MWCKVEVTKKGRFCPVLMGTYQNSIDAKNRLIIPAKFRTELVEKCVITRGLDSCLVIFPMKAWEKQQEQFAALPRTDERARRFLRYVYGNAVDCDIDKQGRIVIPQFLKDFAQIEKDLVTIGMIDRVEVWAKDVFDGAESGGRMGPDDFHDLGDYFRV